MKTVLSEMNDLWIYINNINKKLGLFYHHQTIDAQPYQPIDKILIIILNLKSALEQIEKEINRL